MNRLIVILRFHGIIEADIALESSLFGFRPCSGQGQFTLPRVNSSAISASTLPIEPQDHNQPIHRNPVNSLVMIFRF